MNFIFLGIHPTSHSPGLFSWFPIFFPIKVNYGLVIFFFIETTITSIKLTFTIIMICIILISIWELIKLDVFTKVSLKFAALCNFKESLPCEQCFEIIVGK